MLDALRRHAASWIIKLILGLIIATFIFFFGYQQFANRTLDKSNLAGVVGGKSIPLAKFDRAVETASTRMREDLKEDLPKDFDKVLRSVVLRELIRETVSEEFARSLSLRVSPERLSQAIVEAPSLAGPQGFDYDRYQQVLRPTYQRRTGEDFEKAIEREILIEDLEVVARIGYEAWERALPESKKAEELLASWVRQFEEGLEIETFVR